MNRLQRFFVALAELQHRRAGVWLLCSVLLCAAAFPLVKSLSLDTSFVALLPQDKPSVQDLRALGNRVAGLRTLTVAINSPSKNLDGIQRFIRDAAPRIADLDNLGIRSVDYTLGEYENFIYEHRHLYASLTDLREIRDALQERIDYEKMRRNPLYVSLDDEAPEDPNAIIERMQKKAEEGRHKLDRFPGGLYINEAHDLGVFFIRCDFDGGDNQGQTALVETVRRTLTEMHPERYGADLTFDLAGNVIVSREEHDAILEEVSLAGGLTLVLSMIAIVVFFRRLRVVPILGFSLVVPVLLTFAFAKIAVGGLNTSTAFLGSIVFGNGVNPMIMWLARFFEERRAGQDVLESMKRAHLGVWGGTLSAASTAAAAYGSLVITDFRGFRDFGIIGSAGQLLAWLSMLLVVPAATAMWERYRPLPAPKQENNRNLYGAFFWKLVSGRPRAITVLAALIGVSSLGIVGYAIAHDPLEYNFKKLRSERKTSSAARDINERVGNMLSGTEESSFIAMALPDRSLVQYVVHELDQHRIEQPVSRANYGRVRSIDDLLPTEQNEKLPVLAEIRELLLEAKAYANPAQQQQIDEQIPPENIRPIGDADLPESVARRFTERDGTRGTLLAVERVPEGVSIYDGRYLIRWANSIRQLRLPDGSRPPLAGESTVFADMIESIVHDAPRTIALSFVLTVLLVTFTFRRMRDRLITLASLMLGIAVMGACMALLHLKLNFLNFIAVPIAFGLGVEYSTNVMRRFVEDEAAGVDNPVRAAVEETGGAVILCSLTTILGYVTLHSSASLAIQSFGDAGGISEVACLLSAVIAMPAMLLALKKKKHS